MANEVTKLIRTWQAGDEDALEALIPLVYDELKHLASSRVLRRVVDRAILAGLAC